MIVAWIIAVWLLSLAVFVALRAHGTRRAAGSRDRSTPPQGWTTWSRPDGLPPQRDGTPDSDGRQLEDRHLEDRHPEGRMTERR